MTAALVVTPGDPDGIGPEVTAKALAQLLPELGEVSVQVVGARAPFFHHAALLNLPFDDLGWSFHEPGGGAESIEVASIRWAVDACLGGRASALVTGPIHKAKLARAGFSHSGHTDFLGALCGVERPVMAFVGGPVRVALVTVHIPLREVASAVRAPLVAHTIEVAHHALTQQAGMQDPHITVCGLNPHAGDEGLLGDEDDTHIRPAVEACREGGIRVSGPVSSEAAFCAAVEGKTDLVVAMYHDQGLAPLKALAFGQSVNWTLGLPMIRTSVDHGTAYDLVGTGRASHQSMVSAIRWARTLVTGAS